MPLAFLAALVGAAIVVGMDRVLPGTLGLEPIPFELALGTVAPPPPETGLLVQLLAFHLLVAAAGGGAAAVIAPADRKMLTVACVAFVSSIAAACTGVFQPVGPHWYHSVHFAVAMIGPCLSGNMIVHRRSTASASPPLA